MDSYMLHRVAKKYTAQPPNDNFKSSFVIPVIFTQLFLSKYAIAWWFNLPPATSPVQCTCLTWGNFEIVKMAKLAEMEHFGA